MFNLLDVGVLVIIALCVLAGLYRGFLVAVMGIASYFISWLLAFLLIGVLSSAIQANEPLTTAMVYYTEGSEKIGNVELTRMPVSQVDDVSAIMLDADLPYPMDELVANNITTEAFADEGLVTVGEYFDITIVRFFINVLSFMIIFVIIRTAFAFVIHGVDATLHFPILRSLDGLLGAGFGLINGLLMSFFIFMLVPFIMTVLPFDFITNYVEESFFGLFLYKSNFLLSLIPGV